MNALGLPIVNDGIYPILTPEGSIHYAHPLQLLAKTLAFTDPLTRKWLHFESRQTLQIKPPLGLDATM
jgi:tRNA pseudouridine32 synthase/23S rRNA pseudouridine746 synthase